MEEITTIGLDLAKNIFQAHGSDSGWASSFAQEITTRTIAAVLRQIACLDGGDGGVFQQSSLVPGDWRSGAYGSIDPVRLCEASEE